MGFAFVFVFLLLWTTCGCFEIDTSPCTPKPHAFDPTRHKHVYTVGVLAIRGFEAAYQEFNRTFVDYLGATAGSRFLPSVQFDLKPLSFLSLFSDTEQALVDFIYVNPSAFSCIESEYTARSLVSQISQRNVQGQKYQLKKFGGVILARADRDDLETIHDLRNQIVAAASINSLGSGQMQFLEMQLAGMSYINDPKQLVFTSNQGKTVQGVLEGEFDVGLVRTDQLERTKDELGNPINTSQFKIIDPKPNLTIDGEPFPFQSSTPLYPEWNLAALHHVPEDVAQAVQQSMLALADHARVGQDLLMCPLQHNATYCNNVAMGAFAPMRCDTTRTIAEIAADARSKGKYAGWQTTLSYMPLRSMQQATGFVRQDKSTQVWRCVRSTELYDAIACPADHYKLPEDQVASSCSRQGLTCQDGYQCLCRPCAMIFSCENGVSIHGNCVSYAVLLPSILVPLFVLTFLLVQGYVEYKRRKVADSFWLIPAKEIRWDDPPEMLGDDARVWLAEYRGTQVAVKRVLSMESPNGISDIEEGSFSLLTRERGSFSCWRRTPALSELRHLQELHHPNIVTIMGAVDVAPGPPSLLVLEYVHHGSLYDVLRNPTIVNAIDIIVILQDVVQGLRFLHSSEPRVLHGNLKAKNVLIDGSFRAKVTNYGCWDTTTTSTTTTRRSSQQSSSLFWLAPELLVLGSSGSVTRTTAAKHCTAAADVYAFGILIYEAYACKLPYEDSENPQVVLQQICHHRIDRRPPVPTSCPPNVAELLKQCWARRPADRPTAEQVDLALRVEGGVKERTSRLEALNQELEEANRKIEASSAMQLQHFASMSHELRTPLNCVIGISSLLEDTNLDRSQKESVRMIVSSGKLLRCIVDDVLDYSKLESGNAEVKIKASNLQDIVRETVRCMAGSTIAKRRNIKIRTWFDPFLGETMDTDGRRMLQILYNLLSNAVKYNKESGAVELSIHLCGRRCGNGRGQDGDDSCHSSDFFDEDEDEKAPLMGNKNECSIRFVVKDYGKGIEKEEFERIFRPFTQTVMGVSNTDGGTGLGLAITKQLVEALGGTISVNSKVGSWSEFTVDFPQTSSPADVAFLSSRLEHTKLYYVRPDDDRESNERLAEIFKHFSISFTQVSSTAGLDESTRAAEITASQQEQTTLLLVHGDLCDQSLRTWLSSSSSFSQQGLPSRLPTLVTFGPDPQCQESYRHYRSLLEVFPSVLLRDLGDLVEEALARRLLTQKASSNTTDGRVTNDSSSSSSSLVSSPSSSRQQQQQQQENNLFSHLRILVAEDNLVNQKVLQRLLTRLGVEEIQIVENGQLAVEREAAQVFDIILMDMQMPIMDGLEACQRIVHRRREQVEQQQGTTATTTTTTMTTTTAATTATTTTMTTRPKIIFVSAHVSDSFRRACMQAGGVGYLAKPCCLDSLREVLLKHISSMPSSLLPSSSSSSLSPPSSVAAAGTGTAGGTPLIPQQQ